MSDGHNPNFEHLGHIEEYGDEKIRSGHGHVPGWLIFNYFLWPIVGFFMFYLFWNGSYGWFDRGYWQQLQRAAGTTFPFQTQEEIAEKLDSTQKRQFPKK